MRRAARTDANHRELLDAAGALGAVVVETHQVGKGCPDAFVWTRHTGWLAIEIKTEGGTLTPAQIALAKTCEVTIWRHLAHVIASLTRPLRRPPPSQRNAQQQKPKQRRHKSHPK